MEEKEVFLLKYECATNIFSRFNHECEVLGVFDTKEQAESLIDMSARHLPFRKKDKKKDGSWHRRAFPGGWKLYVERHVMNYFRSDMLESSDDELWNTYDSE